MGGWFVLLQQLRKQPEEKHLSYFFFFIIHLLIFPFNQLFQFCTIKKTTKEIQ
jgi:hypothetical protein